MDEFWKGQRMVLGVGLAFIEGLIIVALLLLIAKGW